MFRVEPSDIFDESCLTYILEAIMTSLRHLQLPWLVLAYCMLSALEIHAQDYSVSTGFLNRNGFQGDRNYTYYFRTNAEHVMLPPANDTLSEWQTLPFPWTFYGQDVQGYFISDNGYITFDPTVTVSVSRNTTLPDDAAPKNAIFAFWSDITLVDGTGQWSNEVATSTVGEAPNRVHLIYWLRVVPNGRSFNNNNLSFLIALYEQGGFDIGFTTQVGGGLGVAGVYGVVGAKSADGLKWQTVTSDSIIAFPPCGYGDADDIGYFFRQPTSVNEDVANSSALQIQPNPSAERITIASTKSSSAQSIGLYDITGRPVVSLHNIPLPYQLDVSGLAQGAYHLVIVAPNCALHHTQVSVKR
jgi:hypothetical protein